MQNRSVSEWLHSLNLDQYDTAFVENHIDFDVLPDLNDQALKDIGVPSVGHRIKLLRAIADLNGEVTVTAPKTKAAQLPEEHGERRQLTVLFCDMVGFTELANGVDPEVLQSIIRRYEDACAVCISRYDGYVFQRLGDGIVAFFGYPLAHEGEAERAIHAGLEIIDSLSKLDVPEVGHVQVRIGIATGLVVVSSAEKGAVGETMNLASRLQGIAQPGSIVVSERVYRLAGGSFEYDKLGAQNLKGIAQPTNAYRIVGVSEAASRFEAAHGNAGLTPLIARERELGLLLDRWALAQEGEGQVVLLSGEPGIGKSRILRALREQLESQGARTLALQCSPYYVNSAFWPSIDNFERALKFARDESPGSKLDKLEALITTQYKRPLADVRFMASLLSIPCEERYGAVSMTPQKHKDETLRTLVDVTEAAARAQPTVMLFEDVHWADPTTLEVLDLLIDRVRTVPLLLVLTHRPEFRSRWAVHGHVTGLNLSKLTRTQSASLVSKLIGGKALPPGLLEQIVSKTDGVPLFVEELTKSTIESGELIDAGNHYDYLGALHDVTIPATLRDSLMARLDRYMPVKEIAQIGAAIGREFSYELIAAVTSRSEAALQIALEGLTASGLAFRRGTPPDAVYTFKHALVQDAAYDSLLKSRRQQLHGKIARVIEKRFDDIKRNEPEVLAHHYTEAGQLLNAIPLWQKAGELAFARLGVNEAISHLTKGLEMLSSLPPSAERDVHELALRTSLGQAWLTLKGWAAPEIWTTLYPGLAIAKSLHRNDTLLPILWGLQLVVQSQGRIAESLPWAKEMLDTADATGDADLLIAAHIKLSDCYLWMGDLIKAVQHGKAVLATCDEEKHRRLANVLNHDPKTTAGAFCSLCTWMLGYPDQAVRFDKESNMRARERAHPFELAWNLTLAAEVYEQRGEPGTVRKRAEECDRLGRDNGLHFVSHCLAPLRYGIASVCEGKAAEGIASLERALAAWDAAGGKCYSPYFKSVLAKGYAMLGELDRAMELIDEQIAQIERPGWEERLHYAEVLRLRGWMLSLRSDLAGAERNYLASLAWSREQQAKSWELRTSMSLAILWQAQGKRKEAYEQLSPIYSWFTEGFDTKDLVGAKKLLKELRS